VRLADEGFIHCSFAHQIEPVANRWYRDLDRLVILRLDADALVAKVRVEPSSDGSGELFPHVYGPIPATAVAETTTWTREAGQEWTLRIAAPDCLPGRTRPAIDRDASAELADAWKQVGPWPAGGAAAPAHEVGVCAEEDEGPLAASRSRPQADPGSEA
jgi:uncharacterized protein (DUF952 family)